MQNIFHKMKGTSKVPPRPKLQEPLVALIGSGLTLIIMAFFNIHFQKNLGLPLLMAPLGASCVLVFAVSQSPLAQPRNILGGHVISAIIGVTVYQFIGDSPMLAMTIAVPLAIAAMDMIGVLHPPGGATAFITAAGGEAIHTLGYWYVLTPCMLGSIILIMIALIFNNVPKEQQYPLFW